VKCRGLNYSPGEVREGENIQKGLSTVQVSESDIFEMKCTRMSNGRGTGHAKLMTVGNSVSILKRTARKTMPNTPVDALACNVNG
jgi:hypothetical protein